MRDRLRRRLARYWRLEALCALLLPGVAVFVLSRAGETLSWLLFVPMAAAAFLLVIGAAAWRLELAVLDGKPETQAAWLPTLVTARPMARALVCAGGVAAGLELFRVGGWTQSAIAAVAFATLAGLEYVNYYVIQLQHFDHLPDFKRLLSGLGFREPHLPKAARRLSGAKRKRPWEEARTRPAVTPSPPTPSTRQPGQTGSCTSRAAHPGRR